jgi:hypothetical protein
MADTKQVYSHVPINLPDEPQHPDRKITVQHGSFGRVIARVYHTDKDNALENAGMIVDALNLTPELLEAVETAQEAIDKVFKIMDNNGNWNDAEIWLNNLAETNQAAIAKATGFKDAIASIIDLQLKAEKAELLEIAQKLCDDFGDNLQTYDAHRYMLVEELRAAIAKATPSPTTGGEE